MTESPLTRASLLIRLRDNSDSDAWNSFIIDYGPMIYRFVRSRGLQDADASDIVQDVMRSVGLAISRLDYQKEKGGFRAWLFAITRNRLSTFFDKRKRQVPTTRESVTSESATQEDFRNGELDRLWELEYQRQLVDKAIATIKPAIDIKTWSAFELTAMKDVAAELAAKQLGMTKGAVYVARSRVTAKLRIEIERLQAEENVSRG
jgi:RNA polymerase sigma-70 factor (ECF subfamily)